jgi:hypothetical protein
MHEIDRTGGKARLRADAVLTAGDFARIAEELGQTSVRARKIGYVAACKATSDETVETRSNGKETTNIARPGDFIVTNLSPQRQPLVDREGHMNVYVIAAERFAGLYESTSETSEHGAIYRAKGVVFALPLPGGLDILAPWGERQRADDGYLLLNGDEVYASSRDAFDATYEAVGS